MIEIGKYNTLKIERSTNVGLFLSDGEKDILLPNKYIPNVYEIGEELIVFVYLDHEERPVATTLEPYIKLNEFGWLRVNYINEFGAFLDWGLEKDLFVPYNEQKYDFLEDKFYVVYVYIDEVSRRIAGSNKLDKFLITEDIKLEGGAEVEILITDESQLGFSCIIEGKYKGLIYHNDVFQDLFIGDELSAYVKTIRPDGLIDISLQKSGFKNVLSATEIVMEYLENHNGFLDLHDKSSPDEIATKFSMSKATFKKAIGILYRHRKVLIKPDGVHLVAGGSEIPLAE